MAANGSVGMPGRAGGVAPGGRTATYTESTLYRIIERTGRGRADAKAKGVKFGRKPKLTPHQQREALERLAQDETQRSVARSYNVSQATISRLRA
jgi:DNA invertase Pin-like site-specific DNA recombinase